jgi:uncharacterized protein with NRDE domain
VFNSGEYKEYATVSSSVLIFDDKGDLLFFERIYDHNEERKFTDDDL